LAASQEIGKAQGNVGLARRALDRRKNLLENNNERHQLS
jgi:hypothetical protein